MRFVLGNHRSLLRRENLHRMFSVLRARLSTRYGEAETLLRLRMLSMPSLQWRLLSVSCNEYLFQASYGRSRSSWL